LTVNFQQDEQELALDGRQIILALVSAFATERSWASMG
jgi:hypothetical protein